MIKLIIKNKLIKLGWKDNQKEYKLCLIKIRKIGRKIRINKIKYKNKNRRWNDWYDMIWFSTQDI